MSSGRKHPIALIVMAQLLGTSLWFSPNSAAASLMLAWNLDATGLGQLTSATQLGFITGTLLLAASGLADRFPASRIFALGCLLGALCNAGFALLADSLETGLLMRFLVGLSLAGIYPLGMKMVISWTRGSAGATLGLLVAMLTLGSALPHGVRAAGIGWAWEAVVLTSSALALAAGALILWLGDGPNLPKAERRGVAWGAALAVFLDRRFRASASGYFGHMWELYAFWTLVPFLVADALAPAAPASTEPLAQWISGLSFVVMGVMGAAGAIWAGHLSQRRGSPPIAAAMLACSGAVCLLYPLVPDAFWWLKLLLLLVWGLTVVADSAQFSATSASVCPPHLVGGALAIQNSAGFLITVCSISLVMALYDAIGPTVAWLLLPGPVLGLIGFRPLLRSQNTGTTPSAR